MVSDHSHYDGESSSVGHATREIALLLDAFKRLSAKTSRAQLEIENDLDHFPEKTFVHPHVFALDFRYLRQGPVCHDTDGQIHQRFTDCRIHSGVR